LTDRGIPVLDSREPAAALETLKANRPLALLIEGYSSDTVLSPEWSVEREAAAHERENRAFVELAREEFQAPVHPKDALKSDRGRCLLPVEGAVVKLLRPLETLGAKKGSASVIVDALLPTTRPYDEPNRHSTDGPAERAALGMERRLAALLAEHSPKLWSAFRPVADPALRAVRPRALSVHSALGPWTAHTLLKVTIRAATSKGSFLSSGTFEAALGKEPGVIPVRFEELAKDREEALLLDDTAVQNLLFNRMGAIRAYQLVATVVPVDGESFRVLALVPSLSSTTADRLSAALRGAGLDGGSSERVERMVARALDVSPSNARLAATFPPYRQEGGRPRKKARLSAQPAGGEGWKEIKGDEAGRADRHDLDPAKVARRIGRPIVRQEQARDYHLHHLDGGEFLISRLGRAIVHAVARDGGLTLDVGPVPGVDPKKDGDKAGYFETLLGYLHAICASGGKTVRVFDRHPRGLKRFLAGSHLHWRRAPEVPGRAWADFTLGKLRGARLLLGSERVPESQRTIQVVLFRRDDPGPDPAAVTLTWGLEESDPVLAAPSAGLLIFGFGNIAGGSGALAQSLGFWVAAYNRSPNERALHALEQGIALYEFDESHAGGARAVGTRQRAEYRARGLHLAGSVRDLLRDGVVVGETDSGAPVRVRVGAVVDGLFGTVKHPATGKTVKASELYKELLFDDAEAMGIPTIYEGANNPQTVARGKVVSQDFILNRGVDPAEILPADAAGRFQSVQCVSCNTTNMWTLSLALAGIPAEERGDLEVNVLLLRKMNDQYVGERRQATGTQGVSLFMQPKYVRDLWQFVQGIEDSVVRERERAEFGPIFDRFTAQVGHQPGTDLHFGVMSLRRRDGQILDASMVKRRLMDPANRHLAVIDFTDRVSSMDFLRVLYYRMGFRSLYVHPAIVLQNGDGVLVVFFTPHLHNVKLNTLVFASILSRRVPPTMEGVAFATDLVDRVLRVPQQKAQMALYFPPVLEVSEEKPARHEALAAAKEATPGAHRPIYFFGAGSAEAVELAPDLRRQLLGGKGAGLAEMSAIEYDDPVTGEPDRIPVPPGYTVTTEQAARYFSENRSIPDDLRQAIITAQLRLESVAGRRLGDPDDPLLVSVRSGARISMPGMMDTVLNLGLNDRSVAGLARRSGNEWFAWDSYRRFVEMFADVVLGVSRERHMKPIRERLLREQGHEDETRLSVEDLRGLVREYHAAVRQATGHPFPQDPTDQLFSAIRAVFESSFNERAVAYRRIHELPEDTVSAVNVVAMVFGNRGPTSATGVALTRDPLTGERVFNGEYLIQAQGEDVVAGIRTGQKIASMADEPHPELSRAYRQLLAVQAALERHYAQPQDIEFTIEEGRLWILQTRGLSARSGRASLRMVTDMVDEELLTPEQALLAFGDPERLNEVLQPIFDDKAERQAEREGRFLTAGLAASVGASHGAAVFSSREAERLGRAGRKVILVRPETSPDDIGGMEAAQGILTSRGGRTSHAAVVARGMGKAAVVGAEEVEINEANKVMRVGGRVIHEGEEISVDGSTGKVYLGILPVVDSPVKRKLLGHPVGPEGEDLYSRLMTLLGWAKAAKALEVRANADNPEDVALAVRLGAEGVGLLRTEHAVLAHVEQRLALSALLLALVGDRPGESEPALKRLFPYLRRLALGIFEVLDDPGHRGPRPCTIRLFDPVVNEFLPTTEAERRGIAEILGITAEEARQRTERVREINPMLGHRGVRLVVASPEIATMQARAAFEAAADRVLAGGRALPEIEIPLVVETREVERVAALVRRTAHEVMAERGVSFEFRVGVMVETPAAVRTANVYAPHIQFISFGMNDLTQTVLAISRDDAGKFLPLYQEQGIFSVDPFKTIDVAVVGSFVEEATARARSTNPGIYVGAAGDLGGDPVSVTFYHQAGLDGVSAAPWLIPVSILSAAQANLQNPRQSGHPIPAAAGVRWEAFAAVTGR
jgi:pyruvate,orthophosphate dikinase